MIKVNNSAIRNPQSAIKLGTLYGIGIGPGDPKLLTIKAKEILDSVSVIFVPKGNENGQSSARSIIEAVVCGKKDFVELTFPMSRNKNKLRAYWHKAAERIVKELKENKNAAFVTLGDPFIYSTYIYLIKTLRQDFPEVPVETVPGISSFNAAASRLGLPLVEGDEKLIILPVTGNLKALKAALKKFDTVVMMKVASRLDKVIRLLTKEKLIKNSVLISHVGHADEVIIRDLSSVKDKRLGYLSVIIVKRGANHMKTTNHQIPITKQISIPNA